MKTMLAALSVVVVVLVAAGCAVTQKSLNEKGLKPMTQKELQDRYASPVKTRWANSQNQSGTAEYTPDGAARLAWTGGGATGKWRAVDGKFCTAYPQVRGGVENCYIVYRTGPKEYMSFNPDGSHNATATVIE